MQYCYLVLFTAVCFACSVSAGPGYVIELTSKNFEHHTQASTGQTSGRWFVFFYEPTRGACIKLLTQWEDMSMQHQGDNIIYAKVNIANSPEIKERFGITDTPHFILFRDQKMYTYKGPVIGHEASKSLHNFYTLDSWKIDAEEIPQPVSKLGSMTKNLKFDLKVMRVYIIYAGLALLAVLAMIMLVVRSSSRTSIQQPPVEIQMKDPAAKKEE
eukprot:TRINITY_DN15704_c0_g1_i3.p1 TRINITY_DN15704_c0_g1~~TRINITY_DN15704_c0_g1_i3.p1  ORF type:complete len:232 (-),score=15.16 TRINITY_DN15704_c0_g1_i3:195-836(-)